MSFDIKNSLGDLVLRFAKLEEVLTEGFATIMNIGYRDAQIVFGVISFNKKVQILNALIRKYYSNDNEKTIFNLLKQANKLGNDRNKIIHSFWNHFVNIGNTEDIKILLKREKLKYNSKDRAKVVTKQFDETEQKELAKIIDDIWKCSSQLIEEFGQIDVDINE